MDFLLFFFVSHEFLRSVGAQAQAESHEFPRIIQKLIYD